MIDLFTQAWEWMVALFVEFFGIKSPSAVLEHSSAEWDKLCDPAYIARLDPRITADEFTGAFMKISTDGMVIAGGGRVEYEEPQILKIAGRDILAEIYELRQLLAPKRALRKCIHCGQWAAVMTECVHCWAAVDPE